MSWKDRFVTLTCMGILSFLVMISVIGAMSKPYSVTIEKIQGQTFAVFRGSNGYISVQKLPDE